jgi:hypothetical protein
MDLRKSLILAAMTVFVSVACGRAADESAEAQAALAAAEVEAQEGGSRAGRLFYEYELAPLAAEVEFAPDFDSKVVLTVAVGDASAGAPLVKAYMNNSKGFERSVVLDLSSGLLSCTESQVGKQNATWLAPPRLVPETAAAYDELLGQLSQQVAAIRSGMSPKFAPHPELDGLVAYLGRVAGEVRATVESQRQR